MDRKWILWKLKGPRNEIAGENIFNAKVHTGKSTRKMTKEPRSGKNRRFHGHRMPIWNNVTTNQKTNSRPRFHPQEQHPHKNPNRWPPQRNGRGHAHWEDCHCCRWFPQEFSMTPKRHGACWRPSATAPFAAMLVRHSTHWRPSGTENITSWPNEAQKSQFRQNGENW